MSTAEGLCGDNSVVSSSSSSSVTVDASQTASASGWWEKPAVATGAKSPSAGAPVACLSQPVVGEMWAIRELGAGRSTLLQGWRCLQAAGRSAGYWRTKPKKDQQDSRLERRKAWRPELNIAIPAQINDRLWSSGSLAPDFDLRCRTFWPFSHSSPRNDNG